MAGDRPRALRVIDIRASLRGGKPALAAHAAQIGAIAFALLPPRSFARRIWNRGECCAQVRGRAALPFFIIICPDNRRQFFHV
jgi:hypothetical protein